ncbi:unnamed protein product, partial [marine sediment metagenome]
MPVGSDPQKRFVDAHAWLGHGRVRGHFFMHDLVRSLAIPVHQQVGGIATIEARPK